MPKNKINIALQNYNFSLNIQARLPHFAGTKQQQQQQQQQQQ